MWKWVSLVEAWAWRVCARSEKDDKLAEFQAFLDTPVNFTWMNPASRRSANRDLRRPHSWQTNKPGESLLSGRKKKKPKGE